MARTWVILGRVLRVPLLAPGDAPADGEGEAEVEAADVQAGGGLDEAAAPHGADFSIPLAEPPRITVMTAAPTAHPFPKHPDQHPYVLCVDSDCILLNFSVHPFKGACFDDRPYQSNLMVVRDYNWAGVEVEQGHPITATAERIPPRQGRQVMVNNVDSIGLICRLDPEDYVIAELVVGRKRAILLCFYPGLRSKWNQDFTDSPLPVAERDREWIPCGVVSCDKMLWWFDLSWGLISYDPIPETAEPLLLFHRLPEGQDLNKAQRGMHDRRCIAVSQGGLRYVAITPDGDAATVSMWTRIPSAHVHDGTVGWMWEEEYTVSFADIWEDDSYAATRLPCKVPALAAVCPSNVNIVYFALEDPKRLFGVNMNTHRVEEFIDESYEMLTPGPEAPPSCRYVLPWILPLQVAHALGKDPLAGDAEGKELIDEEEMQEAEFEDDDDDPLPAIANLPEIKDSELPADDESSDEGALSMAMDPATLARLKSEVAKELEESRSRDPDPRADDAGEGGGF